MYCPNCGAVNSDQASFCELCMTRFVFDAASPGQAGDPVPWGPDVESHDLSAPPSDAYAGKHFDDRETRHRYPGASAAAKYLVTALVSVAVIAGCVIGIIAVLQQFTGEKLEGMYVYESNNADTMLLHASTFVITEGGVTIAGTYDVNGKSITLTPSDPPGLRPLVGTISGKTIIDPEGGRWTKRE